MADSNIGPMVVLDKSFGCGDQDLEWRKWTGQSRDDELKKMVGELTLKVDLLIGRLDLIFGNSVLVNGKFLQIK